MLIILGWIVLLVSVATLCKKSFPKQQELSRKIVHIGVGAVAPMAWFYAVPGRVAIPLAIIITIGLVVNYKFHFFSAFEDIKRKSYGTITYGLSIVLLLSFFWSTNPAAVSAGVMVMAIGDGLAGLIGPQIESPSWKVFNQRKSIAGTFTMAISAATVLTLIAVTSGIPIHPIQILVITCIGTGLEQIGPWGIDNITVPFGVTLSWIGLTSL